MRVRGDHMRVGRVLHEDDDLMTIEVAKNERRELRVEDGDRFLTLMFVHNAGPGQPQRIEAWLPWEN